MSADTSGRMYAGAWSGLQRGERNLSTQLRPPVSRWSGFVMGDEISALMRPLVILFH